MSDGQVGQRPSLRSGPASRVAPQIRQEMTWVRRRSVPAGPPAGAGRGRPLGAAGAVELGQEPRRPPGPATGRAGGGVRQPEPLPGPGDPDVEQPALLLDLLGGLGVRGGQRALGEADQEDRVPLQPLGRVQRGQGHPVDGRHVLLGGPAGQLLVEVGERDRAFHRRRPRRSARTSGVAAYSSASWTSAASASQRSRAAPPAGGASGAQPTAASASTTAAGSGGLPGDRAGGGAQRDHRLAHLGPLEEPLGALHARTAPRPR